MEAKKPKPKSESLEISIRTRSKVLYEGKVLSVTSFNEVGEFDVLPLHANFVTLIKDLIIINSGLANEKRFEIKTGVMNVGEDKVDVYLGL